MNMNQSQKLLVMTGMLLAIYGMLYGLWYALFDEHQTLEQMGGALANGFVQAAERDMAAAQNALQTYDQVKAEYQREVHAHSHWITLGLVLLALGMAYRQVILPDTIKYFVALGLAVGSVIFPLGVFLQIFALGLVAKLLSMAGTFLVIVCFAVAAVGLLRRADSGP